MKDQVRELCSLMLDIDSMVLTNEQHKEALDDFQAKLLALIPGEERIQYSPPGPFDEFPGKLRIRWSCLNHHAHKFKFMAHLCVLLFAKEQEESLLMNRTTYKAKWHCPHCEIEAQALVDVNAEPSSEPIICGNCHKEYAPANIKKCIAKEQEKK